MMVGAVAKLGIYAIECLFAVGIIGSAIVIILTSIEDSEVFFTRNHEPNGQSDSEQPAVQQEPES